MSDGIKGQDSLLLICIAVVLRYYSVAYANITLEEISKWFTCPRECTHSAWTQFWHTMQWTERMWCTLT